MDNGESHLDGFVKHLRILKGLQDSSVAKYRALVREFFAWRAGNDHDGPLGSISRQDVEEYLYWCYRKGNADASRLTKLTALQSYFRYLVYADIIIEDPTTQIPRPQAVRGFMQTFTRDEVLRMFAVCDPTKEKGLRDIVILILGVFAGLRVSEICKLNTEHVIDDGVDIDLQMTRTKKKSHRTVYLWKAPGAYVRALLLIRMAAGGREGGPLLVSCKKNGQPRGHRRLTPKAVDNLVKTIAQRAGIRKPAIKTHMLRATHANDLQHVKGYILPAILERLGWKNLSTADRYLVRRDRVHHIYASLHEYWIGFTKLWTEKDGADAPGRDAAAPGGPAGA
jgi:site-specific recombinase XerD